MAKKPIKKTLSKKKSKASVNIVDDEGSDTEYADDGNMYDSDTESESVPNNIESDKENDDEIDDDDKFGDELENDKDDKDGDNEEDNNDDDNDDKNDDDNDDKNENYSNNDMDEDKCFYKYAKKTEFSDDEEDDGDDFENLDDINNASKNTQLFGENRITKPRLTKYEYVRLLTDRTKQLSLGAKPMIKNAENLSDLQIARLEIQHNIIPLIIERPLPNDQFEIWKISELEVDLVL